MTRRQNRQHSGESHTSPSSEPAEGSASTQHLLRRLRTPAPRSEDLGYRLWILLGLLLTLWLVIRGLFILPRRFGPELGGEMGRVAVLVAFFTLPVGVLLPLTLRPWSVYLLLTGMAIAYLFSLGWLVLFPASESYIFFAFAFVTPLSIEYFWRRRWWYGVMKPESVPDASPPGGIPELLALSGLPCLLAAFVLRTLFFS